MRRFDKADLIKKLLKDMARQTGRLMTLAFFCLISVFFRAFIPFFIGSLICFPLTYVFLNGLMAQGNTEFIQQFLFETISHPLSLLPLYAQWYHDLAENGIHWESRYMLSQLLPAFPVFYGTLAGLRAVLYPSYAPPSFNTAAGRRARLDFLGELLHRWKEQRRGFTDEEFYAGRDDPEELESDGFEEEFFDDEGEDVSAALKTLFISDEVKIFGKETFYDEWAKKTRLAVVFCTPKEANGFFIQAFYNNKLRNRACRDLKGFFKDMADEKAAEEIKKIQTGAFNAAGYEKIGSWERPSLSWRKAKVMFCMIPAPVQMREN